jgi:hypothetical protein
LRRNLFVPAGAQDVAHLASKLESQPFSGSELRVLSLTTNVETNQKLREKLPEANIIVFDVESPTKEGLRETLSHHQKKTVFVLGHFEKGAFVLVNPETHAEFSVSKEELISMARDCCQITIFALGCETALSDGGAGVVTSFDTMDVVDKLPELWRANNLLDAFEALTFGDKGLVLVIDEQFVTEPELEITAVLSTALAGGERVATVFYAAPPPGSEPPGDEDKPLGCSSLLFPALGLVVIAIIGGWIWNRKKDNR